MKPSPCKYCGTIPTLITISTGFWHEQTFYQCINKHCQSGQIERQKKALESWEFKNATKKP